MLLQLDARSHFVIVAAASPIPKNDCAKFDCKWKSQVISICDFLALVDSSFIPDQIANLSQKLGELRALYY